MEMCLRGSFWLIRNMSWKRDLVEALVAVAGKFSPCGARPANPSSMFVLRNNDLGDLLVVTPLFEALKRLHPQARVVAGVGSWNLEVLKGNPFVDEVLTVNAPWHNKFIKNQSVLRTFLYIYGSAEAKALRRRRCDVGIDVLGSPQGSLLLIRARIPWRLGVRGYAGGHQGACQDVEYNPRERVGRASLRFAELLGARDLPPLKPRLFLDAGEEDRGLEIWSQALAGKSAGRLKVVIGPGGGFREKCWPEERFAAVARRLVEELGANGLVVGGAQDREAGERIAAATSGAFVNVAGKLRLRETFAVVARAGLVLCNSSMLMHASAAFDVPTFVFLGPHFDSASDHDLLWGHGERTITLGKGPAHPGIWEVGESFDLIRNYCESHCSFRPAG